MRLALVLTILLAVPAHAVPQCGPRADILKTLATTYGETTRMIGLAPDAVMEVHASETGSWTITMTMATGVTCLLASGSAYDAIPPGVAG
jgi:hypothetical protein